MLVAGSVTAQHIDIANVPKPLFRDPVYDGAADANLIWNDETQEWWMFYTQRRANVSTQGTGWVYGTDIGIGVSKDNGKTWHYTGIAEGLNFEPGRNTWWAPCVRKLGNKYHMFVSYIRGVQFDWRGDGMIAHYTSKNLRDWKFERIVPHQTNVIDPTIHLMPDGNYGLWCTHHGKTWLATSKNLKKWTKHDRPVITDIPHEAPIVFRMNGVYWMVTDPLGDYSGLAVYRSEDCVNWERKSDLMLGGHADIAVDGNKGYIVYFRHFEKEGHSRCTSLHMSEIQEKNGELVVTHW